MPHAALTPARRSSLAELDAAAGIDTTRAKAKLRRARDRLAALREQRSLSLVCRRAWAEGYG